MLGRIAVALMVLALLAAGAVTLTGQLGRDEPEVVRPVDLREDAAPAGAGATGGEGEVRRLRARADRLERDAEALDDRADRATGAERDRLERVADAAEDRADAAEDRADAAEDRFEATRPEAEAFDDDDGDDD